MNLSTLGGLIGGFIFVVVSCLLAGSIKAFIDIPSAVIVLGGTTASILVSFPIHSLKDLMKLLNLLFKKRPLMIKKIIDDFIAYASIIKKDGRLGLEKATISDPLIKKGINFILSNQQEEVLTQMMQQEREVFYEKEMEGQKILDKMTEYAPAWGMIGTLIGLVVMMLNLSDPSKIGPSMAVALITTFYGALFANLVFGPLAYKAETRATENYMLRGIIIEGIVSLSKEDSPRNIEDKLMSFIHHDPHYSKELEKELDTDEGYIK